MKKMYRIGYGAPFGEIQEVAVIRETDACVYIQGRSTVIMEKKQSRSGRYFATWDAAHAHLLQGAKTNVQTSLDAMYGAVEELWRVQAMRKP